MNTIKNSETRDKLFDRLGAILTEIDKIAPPDFGNNLDHIFEEFIKAMFTTDSEFKRLEELFGNKSRGHGYQYFSEVLKRLEVIEVKLKDVLDTIHDIDNLAIKVSNNKALRLKVIEFGLILESIINGVLKINQNRIKETKMLLDEFN